MKRCITSKDYQKVSLSINMNINVHLELEFYTKNFIWQYLRLQK